MLFVRPYANQSRHQVSSAASQPESKEKQSESDPSGLHGEFSQNPPEGDTPIYERGDWTEMDLSMGADKEATLPMRFKSMCIEPQFFWGFIEYKDIFKHRRISRFCTFIYPSMDMQPGKFETAGSASWREGD
jgi:hypothetical protein